MLLMMTITIITTAQQTGMFSQFSESLMLYNPAFTGYRNSLNATMMYRIQWVGFEGAPSSQMIAVDSKISRSSASIGGIIFLDQAGPLRQTSFSFNAAYQMKIDRKQFLSFGLKLSGFLYNVSLTDREIVDETDEVYTRDIESLLRPNTGAGILYTSRNFFASLSSPNILKNQLDKGEAYLVERDNYKKATNYLMIGYLFDIDKMIKLKTIALARTTAGAPISGGVNINLILKDGGSYGRTRPDKVNLGINYYFAEQLSFYTQLRVKKKFLVGYAASLAASKLSGYAGLTHEVMLNYSLRFERKGRQRVVSPAKF